MDTLRAVKKIWLVQWGAAAMDENRILAQYGIKNKIVDLISIRKSFDTYITEYAKRLYQMHMLTFSEKVYHEHYTLGKKRKEQLFGSAVPCNTHYQSGLYQELMECAQSDEAESGRYGELIARWKTHPQYIIVGHNPFLEIVEVHNLVVYENQEGSEVIEWDHPLASGEMRREIYTFAR